MLLETRELLELLMRPWVNLTRYHDVFGPASPWRRRVVPKARADAVSCPGATWIQFGIPNSVILLRMLQAVRTSLHCSSSFLALNRAPKRFLVR